MKENLAIGISSDDDRIVDFSIISEMLVSIGNVRAVFTSTNNSEMIIVIRKGFYIDKLIPIKNLLPIFIQIGYFPDDPTIIYSRSCTKVNSIKTIEIEGSPNRLMLMYRGLEKIF